MEVKTQTIQIPDSIARLYALTDAERFPAAQLGEGLERASSLYYADFMVAVPFGMPALEDTFKRTFYKTAGYKMVTELAVALNHIGWLMYSFAETATKDARPEDAKRYEGISQWFFERYNEVNDWAYVNLKEDEILFYHSILD